MSKKETIIAFVILGIYALVVAVGSIFYLSYTSPNESFASLRKYKKTETKTATTENNNEEQGDSATVKKSTQLTVDQLKNGYYTIDGKSFKMAAGTATVGTDTYTLEDKYSAFNGNTETATIVKRTTGGTGAFRYLVIMGQKGESAQYIADTYLGDRVQIESILFEKDVVTLGMITQGPNDPSCCPTQKTVKMFRLTSDSKLVSL